MFLKIANKLSKVKDGITAKKNGKEGFSLIELIVVVVIIAILVAIATQDMGRTTEDSKIARAKADIRTLSGALDIYYADTGNKVNGEITSTGGAICDTLTQAGTKIDGSPAGPWIKSCPVPPWNDANYVVSGDDTGNSFRHVITITSPNGVTISSKNLATTTTN